MGHPHDIAADRLQLALICNLSPEKSLLVVQKEVRLGFPAPSSGRLLPQSEMRYGSRMPLLRVLLVDDSPADRFLAQEVFSAHGGTVSLTLTESGDTALAHLNTPDAPLPDVLLLDLNMPGMSGLDVLTEVKQSPTLHHIPVVMLTTSHARLDVEAAYALQASGYLVKSSDFGSFLQQIEAFVTYWSGHLFALPALP